jgi:four helix bundle protein
MTRQELEKRLIDIAVLIIRIADSLQNTRSGVTMPNQIIRSGTSPALSYGEAQSAESTNDFIHKCQVVLKELRETFVSLKIIDKAKVCSVTDDLNYALKENNELINIFVSTVNKLKRSRATK